MSCVCWLVVLAAVAGCGRGKARQAVVVVSGDTAGWITPCGCTSNQSGGLLRRGTYLAQMRGQGDVVYADVGGAPAGKSEYQRLKFEAILRGEMAMGVAAHNLGGAEIALGAGYLRELETRMGAPLVSANARDKEGREIASPYRIVTAGGKRVALVGVVSPRYASGDVRVDDPHAAVLAALDGAKGKYDSVVVLAYLGEEELQDLAAKLPEADVVVGGPTGQAMMPRRAGPTLLASATNKGKFLVRLSVPSPAVQAVWEGTVVELDKSYGDDPVQSRNFQAYLGELKERDFVAGQAGLVAELPAERPADYRVAGTAACLECHAGDRKAWESMKHAFAWKDLQDRGSAVDPYCQQCHTTGYGMPGGFESVRRSSAMTSVGCEACHGPSLAHVREPSVKTTYVAKNQCTACHDAENSPKFGYDEYWKLIRHGDVKGTRTAGGAVAAALAAPTTREVGP